MSSPASATEQRLNARISELLIGGSLELLPKELHRASELAALLRRASVCVTNDSGPVHLAVALDRAVVSIFGPTDPVWAGPYRRDNAVLRAQLPCSPCYLRQLSRCNFGHACMKDVSAGAVIERVDGILAKQPARAKTTAPQASQR